MMFDSSGACEQSQTWLWCYTDATLQGLSSLVHVPRALNVVTGADVDGGVSC